MKPTDPSWLDGYRAAMRDAINVARMWAGISRANAAKLASRWDSDVNQQAATLLHKLVTVFEVMAERPRRDVSMDDDVTPRREI